MSRTRKPIDWAEIARESRRRLGLPASAWAKLLGVSLRTVRYWEAGEVRPPMDRIALMFKYRRVQCKNAKRS